MTDREWIEAAQRRYQKRIDAYGEALAQCLACNNDINQRRVLNAESALRAAGNELGRIRKIVNAQ